MAAISIPRPGTDLGPCASRCEHRDCAESRQQATARCDLCGLRVGYQTAFVKAADGRHSKLVTPSGLAHLTCYEADVARRRSR